MSLEYQFLHNLVFFQKAEKYVTYLFLYTDSSYLFLFFPFLYCHYNTSYCNQKLIGFLTRFSCLIFLTNPG